MNPRSERLAELIAQQQPKRIHQPRLMALYAEADPMSAGSVDRRRLLAEALAELVADGLVRRAASSDDGQPPLPRYVDRVTTPKPTPARRAVIWHSDLGWAAERLLTDKQFQLLAAVNEWIFKQRAGAAEAPLRERALQITGDEKAFDGGVVTDDTDGTLTLNVLRACRVVLRLHAERVGDGPVCLVVENSDTFDSLCRALARDPGPVGPEEHRDAAQALLVSKHRLAQEAIGRDVLAATDGWRDGLGR